MPSERRPPNVLFLMSDEHRADVAGYAGDPVIRTPVLDEVARTGVVFDNAYAASPICVPGRQAMAAGQLPRTCRCEQFGHDLPPFSMTFAKRFSQLGYQTRCFGKLHHGGADQMQGWMHRPVGDLDVRPGHIGGTDLDRVQRFAAAPYSGIGKWTQDKEVRRAGPGRSHVNNKDDLAVEGLCQWAVDNHFANPHYDRPAPWQPVLVKLSQLRPHYPYFCDEEKFTYYLNRVTPYIERETFDHPFLSRFKVTPDEDVTVRDLYRATAAYYGMIEELDDGFGRAMATLEHVGEDLDDWLIVYTSDHGEMLGEHGVWEKQKFFEGSARVPLVIRPPRWLRDAWGCEGRTVRENVNLCDLFATLCELCDVPLPEEADTVHGAGLDSRSLAPLMRGDTTHWHEAYHNETISQFGSTNLLIKRDALKYQWYGREDCAGGHEEVLFDLDADPGERRNLIAEPGYADLLETFRQRRGELGFGPNADANYRNAGYAQTAAAK